jgi:flagellar basal body-associated protein FliL
MKKSKRATQGRWTAALTLLATGGLVALLVLARSVGGWGLEAFPPNPFSRVMGEDDYRERAAKPIVSLPDVVVALNGQSDLYVDAAFDLEVASEQDRDAVKRQLPRVRNETIAFLSQLTPDALRGSAELSKTKARLLDRFRDVLPRQRLDALYLSYLAVAAK